jgi:hypothetical protein
MRKTLLALVLAACAALTLPAAANAAPSHAAPATAGPSVVHPMGPSGGYGLCLPTPGGWICVVVVFVPWPCPCPPPSGCPDCPEAIDFGLTVLPPSVDTQIYRNILTGMGDLGQATATTDPQQIAALRAAAMSSFTNAAKMLGGLQLTSKPVVGFLDANGKFDPDPAPWRQQAGSDLSAGLTELQQSFTSPNPSSLRAAAAANFDAANKIYAQLAGGVQR